MRKGHGINEKYAENPIGSDEPRGKNRERRKHKLDGSSLTPTEAHIKNSLMRQFMRNPEGSEGRDESAYKSASCWCSGPCGGRRLAIRNGRCEGCAQAHEYLHGPSDSDADRRVWTGFDANGAPVE